MSNKLKKFIWDNRKEFDDEVPPEKIWENIEASFAVKKKKKFVLTAFYKWSIAAAAMLIIASGIYFMVDKKNAVVPGIVKIEPDKLMIPDAPPEMNQFVKMIDLKQEELKVLAKDQPELYQRFTKDINQLDSSYNILRKRLSATPNRELLLEAMIQNLQLQLSVLNQQLNIINQIKKQKYSHEKIDQAI